MASNRDIQLVIKAKDEATAAFQAATAALAGMVKQAGAAGRASEGSGSQLQTMAQAALSVDKALALLTGRIDGANQGLANQASAIAGSKQRLADLKAQLQGAAAAAESLQTAIVDANLNGLDTAPLVQKLQAIPGAMAALRKEAGAVERTLVSQQTTFSNSSTALTELEARTQSLGIASGVARRQVAGLTQELNQQQAAQQRANRSPADKLRSGSPTVDRAVLADTTLEQVLGRVNAKGAQVAQANAAAATELARQMREAAQAAEEEDAAISRLRATLNPLVGLEARLAAETAKYNGWLQRGKIDANEHTLAMVRLNKEFERAKRNMGKGAVDSKGRPSLFGLTPFEMQNLSFQVNDVFTQLASGTGILQTLAQQGGQIIQIFPKAGSAIVAALRNPYILAAAAAMAVLTISIRRGADEAERLRKVEGILKGMGDGAEKSAGKVAEAVRAIELIGFTSEQATKALRDFVNEGLKPEFLLQFAEAARNVSDITGKDLPQSLDLLKEAFSGGYKQVAQLDDQLQFLTVSEREEIRSMFESGRAAEARAKAFQLLEERGDAVASKMRGNWASASHTLSTRFGELFDTLGRSDWVQGLVKGIDEFLDHMNVALKKFDELNLKQAEARLAQLKQDRQAAQGTRGPNDKVVTTFGADTIDKQIVDLEKYIAKIKETKRAEGDPVDPASASRAKRRSDLLREMQLTEQLDSTASSARRVAIRGEQAYTKALQDTGDTIIAQRAKEIELGKARKEESRRLEQETRERNRRFAQQIDDNGREGLLDTAGRFVGRNENSAGDRGVLQDLFKAANVKVDPKITAWCAAFVNAVLATNGLPTVAQSTGGSDLRAKDFLGFGQKVTEPEPGDIVIIKGRGAGGHVGFFQGFTDNGGVRVLGGNQGKTGQGAVNSEVFRPSSVLGFRRAPSLGDVAEQQQKADAKRAEQQGQFNESIDAEVDKRNRDIAAMKQQQSLSGEALIAAKRQEAIDEALAEARVKAAKDEIKLGDDRAAAIAKSVGEEFDLLHARERATAALDSAKGERDALLERLDLAEKIGDPKLIEQGEQAIHSIDDAMRKAIDTALAFWKSMGDTPEARAAIQNLENARQSLELDARDRERARVEKPVSQFQQLRNGLQEQINFAQNLGQTAVVDQLREQLKEVDAQFVGAIDSAIKFWEAQSGPEAQAALLNLENLRNQVIAANNEFVITAGQVQDAFATSFEDGFKTFAQRLVETRDLFGSLAAAGLTFAQSFIQQLAEIGLKMLALKTAKSLGFGGLADGLNSGFGLANSAALTTGAATLSAAGATVTAGGAAVTAGAAALGVSAAALAAAAQLMIVANATSFGVAHDGGIAGMQSRSRSISPAWFAGARRYHSGGIAGLRANEVPIIAERGEEIITKSDPRHRANGRGAAAGAERGRSQTQILAIGDKEIASAMRSASGEEVTLTHLKRNRETVRALLR